MTEAGRVICSLDALVDFADKMASASGKHWRKMAKAAAEARDAIDQLLRDLAAMEYVRDGRAVKIIYRGVVMINFDWWRRLLEAEGKWRCVPEIEDLEKADAEALSVAAATSPPEGETRGEAAGWISVEDRQPAKYGMYRVKRRTRGRKVEEDTYLWNGAYWVTHGNSISKAVEEWLEEE